MAILVCIDGTGDSDDQQYRREFRRSFVHRIFDGFPGARADRYYHRGPTAAGFEMESLITGARNFITDRYVAPTRTIRLETTPVLVTGYSRGAAAVVILAQRLQRDHGIPVRGMALFDCVDRAIGADMDATRVSDDVQWLLHATRDDRAGSRESFGHAATEVPAHLRSSGNYHHRAFFGTHGAIGGVPWTGGPPANYIYERPERAASRVTYARDPECAQEVWAWASPLLRQRGFVQRPGQPAFEFSLP